jgi:hypothetical protein
MYILQMCAVNGILKIPTELGRCETEHRGSSRSAAN